VTNLIDKIDNERVRPPPPSPVLLRRKAVDVASLNEEDRKVIEPHPDLGPQVPPPAVLPVAANVVGLGEAGPSEKAGDVDMVTAGKQKSQK
jgi:hypothetical protein